MEKVCYDLHIHSCLSPCCDNDMTPPNIANMAYLKGLELIAITDHNSARNVRAVMEAAAQLAITVIGGLELTTAEEIHVVCLFPTADAAEAAGAEAESLLPDLANDEEIFGTQRVVAADEAELGRVQKLLINATSISFDDVQEFAARHGGFCYPAHIDRPANSLLATFGCLPDHLSLPVVEVFRPESFLQTPQGEAVAVTRRVVTSSDAHRLVNISEEGRTLTLSSCSFEGLREMLTGDYDSLL